MTARITIAAQRARLASGETSSVALLEDLQARLSRRPVLAPFVHLDWGRAFGAAEARDRARRAGAPPGPQPGPLDGVPLAHKDMFDRAGSPTGYGAHGTAARVASGTATLIARLDAAGAVDFGRLAMSEFAMGPTGINHHHGMPANPAVPGAIPGGSSSGSAVAVAAGWVPAALGSDTGGSIRLPAACTGVVGFKPGPGLVPMDGVMPLSWTQDCVGPLAASVACARAVLEAISGRSLTGGAGGDLRIGIDRGAFCDGVSARALEAQTEACKALAGAGHATRRVDLSFFRDLDEPANVIAVSEAAAVHADRLRSHADLYGPEVRARLVQAAAIPAQAYLRALQIRQAAIARLQADLFSVVDVLILPTLPDVPPQAASLSGL